MDATSHRPPHRPPHRRRLAGAAVATLLSLTAVAACAGSEEPMSSADGEVAGLGAPQVPGSDEGGGEPAVEPGDADAATSEAVRGDGPGSVADQVSEAARSVIATGTVSLRAEDVEDARFDVQRVVDEHAGEVADEETGTDRDGVVRRSRLVLRVPVESFDEVMTRLAQVAQLSRTTRTAEDVTTQVIDTEVRVRAQRRSLQRIEALLARAKDLEDIVAIETELTRRQAELDSLEQQQAWLADQTSMATVTVLLERADEPEEAEEPTGFVAGLAAGWDALERSTLAVLTAAGALLPFAVLAALLAVPARLLLRRLSARWARRSARTPSAAPAVPGPSTG